MAYTKSAPRKHQSADSPTVLFAGVPGRKADTIVAAFRQMGWAVMALSDQDEIEAIFAGFKDQLLKSVADCVLPKPADPKPYLINSTLAETCRLQNSAPPLP